MLQVETKNAMFGSITDEKMKKHHLPFSKRFSLRAVFLAIPSFGHSIHFNVSSKVFELIFGLYNMSGNFLQHCKRWNVIQW